MCVGDLHYQIKWRQMKRWQQENHGQTQSSFFLKGENTRTHQEYFAIVQTYLGPSVSYLRRQVSVKKQFLLSLNLMGIGEIFWLTMPK